jgi:alkylation response protein AidB-like acyl-CoA dehydrogenase
MFSLCVAAVALGIARGAIADITALAGAKVPLLAGAALATSPTFQRDLARADTQLRAARALVIESAEDAWSTATRGADFTLDQRARIRAAAAWAVETSADVVTTAYRAGGGTVVYRDGTLQRRLRDVNAVTQHFLVRPDTLTTAGAVFAGQEIDVPVF